MKFKTWTAGIAVLTLAAAPAFAEDSLAQWSYDQMVTPVGCCDSGCDCGDSCDCGSACGGGCLLSGIGPGIVEGFSIAGLLGIDNWDVGGWTQIGYTDEATLLTPLGGASFNDTPDRLNLHQQYFYVGKAADGSNGFDIGFRADFVYGIDGPDTQAFGNPADSFDFGGSFTRGDDNHGWAIPQLYGEVAVGDLNVKIGHFYTLVGYEVVTAPDNFFFSHALTQYNSEPFTHTGVLASYEGFEGMTLYGGWTLGWDTGFDQLNQGNSFLGGFSVGLGDSVTMTYINTYGNFGWLDAGDDDSYSHSIVFDVALADSFQYVFQSDMVRTDEVAFYDTFGINQYFIYNFNDCLSFGSRIEWWKADGVSYYGYTSGVNVKLLDNLILRPEYRTDWSPGTVVDGSSYDESIFGCDCILTY